MVHALRTYYIAHFVIIYISTYVRTYMNMNEHFKFFLLHLQLQSIAIIFDNHYHITDLSKSQNPVQTMQYYTNYVN